MATTPETAASGPREARVQGRAMKAAVAAAIALAVLAFVGARVYESRVVGPRVDEKTLDVLRVDVAAPDVVLSGADGKPFALSQFKGQVVFVNFWATWCPPCRVEMPSMLALAREMERSHPGKFKMVAVSNDEEWGAVHAYFQNVFGGPPQGVTLALDDGRAAKAYYCAARGKCPDIKFPETYVLDKSGRLVAYIVADRDWSDPAARRFLERLIEG